MSPDTGGGVAPISVDEPSTQPRAPTTFPASHARARSRLCCTEGAIGSAEVAPVERESKRRVPSSQHLVGSKATTQKLRDSIDRLTNM